MKHRLLRAILLACATAGLTMVPVSPASATTEATLTFVASATTGSGLAAPCSSLGTTNCLPPGPTVGFLLSSTTCSGHKIDVNKPKGNQVYGPLCFLTASGFGNGFCGLFQGQAVAQLGFTGPSGTKYFNVTFSFVLTGTTGFFTGAGEKTPGGGTGTLVGTGQILAQEGPLGNGSCLTGTQTQFIISGTLTYFEPTA